MNLVGKGFDLCFIRPRFLFQLNVGFGDTFIFLLESVQSYFLSLHFHSVINEIFFYDSFELFFIGSETLFQRV